MSEGQRRAGRPRRPATDRAILDAVVAILCEQGFDAVTIEAVATEAGVSRPTVYRRYSDRTELAHAAIRDAIEGQLPEPEPSASPYGQVVNLLNNTVVMLTSTSIGPIFRAMIPHLADDPRLGELANQVGWERRRVLKDAVEAARAAGQLPSDRDLDTVIDGLIGAIYFRFLITQRNLDEAYIQKLLDGIG